MQKSQSIQMREVTVTAPVNIAVIKYWGKRDVPLMLPTNSSLSLTLCQDDMRAKTTGRLSSDLTGDSLVLNGAVEVISKGRVAAVVGRVRMMRQGLENADTSLDKLASMSLRVVSENNFPTAAGLASSAAGFAALAFCLANLYDLNLNLSQISALARLGSGSACRSLFGGYVEWQAGVLEDGSDSIAVQVAPASHWPMRALVLVASDAKKHVGSSVGMQTTVETSELLAYRCANVVPARITAMRHAIATKDFELFADVTMKDSNSFHAVCLDTFPPISYMTPVSFAVVRVVHALNAAVGRAVCAYTFDAGPNAVLYVQDEDVALVREVVRHFFPVLGVCEREYYGESWRENAEKCGEYVSVIVEIELTIEVQVANSLKRIISTGVGEGPVLLAAEYKQGVSLMQDDGVAV